MVLESALTTIVDLEDSVAAVDAADKAEAYRNWLGLMRGDLSATFRKGGETLTRALEPDRQWTAPDGSSVTLKGRSLLFVRNVGHLMTTPAIRLADGSEAPEGIMDAIVTSLIALYDIKGLGGFGNSATGSVYIVKPKMHGPEEVAFTDQLLDVRSRTLLGLDRFTRSRSGSWTRNSRTTVNLARNAFDAAKAPGRSLSTPGSWTGRATRCTRRWKPGPMIRKKDMKTSRLDGHLRRLRNVDVGLKPAVSRGTAQIGKGMWAACLTSWPTC